MKYAEAMEYSRLLNFEPDVAYAESFKRAIAAEEAFKNQMAFESTLGTLIDDVDSLREDNIEIATEAANAVVDTLKKIATWFKNLLTKFKAMVRKIIFKSRVKANDKAVSKMAKASVKNTGSTQAFKSNTVKLSDEEFTKYSQVFKDLDGLGVKAGFLKQEMNPMELANLSKMVSSRGDACEKELADAMKNPSPETSVKDLNQKCKLVAQAMKVITIMLNKAVKSGAVQSKDEKAETVTPSANDVTDKNGNPAKQEG